ncbi:MAG: Flp pilus assembly complex ATPase component TadA, partial [Deltaproteobacteria bacterium]|nr:Flp pilus assembly complex ATPase component TadA [Deltaproteobacteria bacterium]
KGVARRRLRRMSHHTAPSRKRRRNRKRQSRKRQWSPTHRAIDLTDFLVATHTVEEDKVVRALADEVGMEFVEKIASELIPEELIDAVPINFARQNLVLPLTQTDGSVRVAIANPLDSFPIDDLRILLQKTIIPVAASEETIDDAINRVYERKDETALAEAKEGEEVEELRDLIDMTDEAPVIRWVNNLFYTAVKERASDIHIEPTEDKVIVRYRVDGRLIPRKEANRGFLSSIVSRVKIEAGLNIAEKRLPQDGRITKKIAGKVVDVRVSRIPTAKGERVVMRLLDKEQVMLNLIDLGFARRELDQLENLIRRPNGIILVTGPTGSGKTTTLYGCLNTINTPEKNILTVEDPVEYELRGIGQMQVQPKIGLTFATGLRSFLRQDPDVIMVGEIRDHETAEIAIHASLTGHLVLSTLHTNDAPSAITRLVDMDVKAYQISSSVLAVLAQRLVRKLCEECKIPYAPTAQDLRELGIDAAIAQEKLAELQRLAATTVIGRSNPPTLPDPAGADSGKLTFYHHAGCDVCSNTGYRGRIGIFELMMIDEPVRREILNNSDAKTIQRVAQQQGMRLLREDGARQVVAGITSVEEVLAATQAAEV